MGFARETIAESTGAQSRSRSGYATESAVESIVAGTTTLRARDNPRSCFAAAVASTTAALDDAALQGLLKSDPGRAVSCALAASSLGDARASSARADVDNASAGVTEGGVLQQTEDLFHDLEQLTRKGDELQVVQVSLLRQQTSALLGEVAALRDDVAMLRDQQDLGVARQAWGSVGRSRGTGETHVADGSPRALAACQRLEERVKLVEDKVDAESRHRVARDAETPPAIGKESAARLAINAEMKEMLERQSAKLERQFVEHGERVRSSVDELQGMLQDAVAKESASRQSHFDLLKASIADERAARESADEQIALLDSFLQDMRTIYVEKGAFERPLLRPAIAQAASTSTGSSRRMSSVPAPAVRDAKPTLATHSKMSDELPPSSGGQLRPLGSTFDGSKGLHSPCSRPLRAFFAGA